MSIQPKPANSSPVHSAQTDVHARLLEVLERHQNHPDRTPIADFSQAIWSQAHEFLRSRPNFVLDFGCGTGHSTGNLARKYPECAVLGVDRSIARLDKKPESTMPANALCLRMDQYDLLRLLAAEHLQAQISYLLYPNPSPKAEHLKRRWHAHPIFPTLLAQSKALQLRTNWSVYAREFTAALKHSGWRAELVEAAPEPDPISLFEAKYQASGHGIYRVNGVRKSAQSLPC